MRLLPALLALPLSVQAALPLEQRWTLRDLAGAARNSSAEVPAFDPATFSLKPKRLFRDDWAQAQEHSLRYDGALGGSAGLRLEWNLLATLSLASSSSPLPPPDQPPGRSAVLQRRWQQNAYERLDAEVDQLALRWQSDRLNVAVGRQSVNLGESFFFSPLDLFLPFVAQQTYREFRPGVDAVRATVSPSSFSLVELIAVAGYAPLVAGSNTTDHPLLLEGRGAQGSLLGRLQLGGERWSGTALVGKVRSANTYGLAAQVELGDRSLTLETLASDAEASWNRLETTLGTTQQWNSAASTRFEYSWAVAGPPAERSTQAKAGANLSLQAGPLLTLTPAFFWYITERNADFMLSASVSVSDESVLELGVNAPILIPGHSAVGLGAMDLAPHTFSVELRSVL